MTITSKGTNAKGEPTNNIAVYMMDRNVRRWAPCW